MDFEGEVGVFVFSVTDVVVVVVATADAVVVEGGAISLRNFSRLALAFFFRPACFFSQRLDVLFE